MTNIYTNKAEYIIYLKNQNSKCIKNRSKCIQN